MVPRAKDADHGLRSRGGAGHQTVCVLCGVSARAVDGRETASRGRAGHRQRVYAPRPKVRGRGARHILRDDRRDGVRTRPAHSPRHSLDRVLGRRRDRRGIRARDQVPVVAQDRAGRGPAPLLPPGPDLHGNLRPRGDQVHSVQACVDHVAARSRVRRHLGPAEPRVVCRRSPETPGILRGNDDGAKRTVGGAKRTVGGAKRTVGGAKRTPSKRPVGGAATAAGIADHETRENRRKVVLHRT